MKDALPHSSIDSKRRPWLGWIAAVVLVAGIGVAALALAAPLGVWLGAWEFGTGFSILGAAHGHAYRVAIGAVIATIVVFGIGWMTSAGNTRSAVALAAIGTLAAGLAYLIPESYRPAEGVPPIHDISTDTVDPPEFVAVLPLRADAPNTTVYGGTEDVTPEELARLTSEAYPDLTTRRLDVSADAAFDGALAAVEALGWELVDADRDAGRIEATDTTFWFRFKDDIVIRIRPDPPGALVDARSVSRVGRGDAGTNARRLRAFFDSL